MGLDEVLKADTLIFSPEYGEDIINSEFVKDLGVLVDNILQYKEQRLKAIQKANQKSGWVLRTFKDRSVDYMRRMWRSLIQPHKDYCCMVWAPIHLKVIRVTYKHRRDLCTHLQNVRGDKRMRIIGTD